MDSEETTKKQHYLVNKIINRGYNPDDFVEFISKKKEHGDDIQNWTMDELKDLVDEFVDSLPEQTNPSAPEPQEEESPHHSTHSTPKHHEQEADKEPVFFDVHEIAGDDWLANKRIEAHEYLKKNRVSSILTPGLRHDHQVSEDSSNGTTACQLQSFPNKQQNRQRRLLLTELRGLQAGNAESGRSGGEKIQRVLLAQRRADQRFSRLLHSTDGEERSRH